jgi:hypothetical protein
MKQVFTLSKMERVGYEVFKDTFAKSRLFIRIVPLKISQNFVKRVF